MDGFFVDDRGRKRPLDSELVFELLGDGSQSDLDISDEEAEPRIEVRRLLDEDIPDQELPNAENESDPEIDVPMAQIARNNRENIPPTRSSNTARNIREKQRPRLWRRTEFNDKTHEYSTSLPAQDIKTPLQYFEEYFNEFFFENMASCTNIYALRKKGIVLNTNKQEMRKLFGIFLIMGCIPFPRIHMYWRSGMRLDIIAEKMPRERFFLLRNNMHVVDTEDAPEGNTNPLWMVLPVINAVKNTCMKLERVPGFYSIDEQIIPFAGKCHLKILVKNKPRPLGLKNYVLTTSDGLMLNFEIYYPNNPAFEDRSLGEGPAVILGLAKNVPPNSCLYFDRYFNTIPLLDRLQEINLHGTGTIMLNRIPDHKKLDLKSDKGLQRGDVVQYTSKDVALVKWKDNKGVLMASNCTGGNNTSYIPRWCKKTKQYVDVSAPRIVLNYNKNMGGVDQLLEYYRTYQKTRKWTLR